MKERKSFDGVRTTLSRPSAWLTIFLIMGLVGVAIYASLTLSNLKVNIEAKQTEVEKLEGDVLALEKTQKLTVKDGKEIVSSAKKDGEAVAEIQNGYATAPSDQLRSQTAKLDPYFTEDDHGSKSMWYSVRAVAGTKWEFMTPYMFSGAYTDVVWQCKKDGQLFAYVTAKYNATSHKFTDIQKHETQIGTKAYQTASESDTLKQYDATPPASNNEQGGEGR